MKLARKDHIILVIVLITLLAGCSLFNNGDDKAAVLPVKDRPNVILILADDLDQKLGTIDYMANLKTHLIDRGVTIQDFLITTPMCCPSRVNLLRSEYTHSHQVFNNEAPFGGFPKFFETGGEISTLPVWLQAAGYHTALIGKYLNEYPLKENRTYVPPGWSEWYSPGRKNAYDGYDFYLNENGKLVPYGLDEESYFTDVMSRKSVDFIQRMANNQDPFFLYLAPFVPHEPSVAAKRHEALLQDIHAPQSPSFNEEDVSDKPSSFQNTPLLTEDDIADIDLIYRKRVLSMLAVDEMIAQIIKTLEETNELENTYIIFTSDQGFHLGQHRLLQGKSSFYDEDIVVPFIVRGPGIPAGKTINPFLSGVVDIAPTIAEWAGVVPPKFAVGRSFASALTDGAVSTDWRHGFLLEQYSFSLNKDSGGVSLPGLMVWFGALPGAPVQPYKEELPKSAGVRTLQYTYIEHPDGVVEMYDLSKDPYEMENLASSASPDLLGSFAAFLHDMEVCHGEECKMIEGRFNP